jgi:hypothetical protein
MQPRLGFACLTLGVLLGCGVASISPILSNADVEYNPALLGTWEETDGKEFAVITPDTGKRYHVVYHESDGKVGAFTGRLGRLGKFRVLELQPDDPTLDRNMGDVYRSLIVRAYAVVFIDSIGSELQFRALAPDSVSAALKKKPSSVAHNASGDLTLFTGPTGDVRKFLTQMAQRKGVLGDTARWRRRAR